MARPTTKPDLIRAANETFDKLCSLLSSLSPEALAAPFAFGDEANKKEAHWKRDKNMRDVLVHLYEWHQLLLHWVADNLNGTASPFLPAPYNWTTYGEMNQAFWEKHQTTSYETAAKWLAGSHKRCLALIEQFTNEELFEKKHYSWTGSTNLGSYCISATTSHYDWAMKKFKVHKKMMQA